MREGERDVSSQDVSSSLAIYNSLRRNIHQELILWKVMRAKSASESPLVH